MRLLVVAILNTINNLDRQQPGILSHNMLKNIGLQYLAKQANIIYAFVSNILCSTILCLFHIVQKVAILNFKGRISSTVIIDN